MNGVHEEIVPSLIHAVGDGALVDVFVNARCRDKRGDIFAHSPNFGARIRYVPIEGSQDWTDLAATLDAGSYDLLVFSTLQTDSFANFARARGKPILGVVHNLRMFQQSDPCKGLLDDGILMPLTLAPHVAMAFHAATGGAHIDRIGVVEPVVWQDGAAAASSDGRRHVAIPGGVQFRNRAFEELVTTLAGGLAADLARADIALQVLGGGADRAALERMVTDRDLGEVITFAARGESEMVEYDTYLAALRQAWALYPLLPVHALPYRQFKITSAIPTALGFGLPFVLDRWTHQVYRSPAIVAGATVADHLRALLDLDAASHGEHRAEIAAYVKAATARNRAEIARIIDRILP